MSRFSKKKVDVKSTQMEESVTSDKEEHEIKKDWDFVFDRFNF